MLKKNKNIFDKLFRIKSFISSCNVKLYLFFLAILLAGLTSLLEGLSLSLLAPAFDIAVQGVVEARKESWLVRQIKTFTGIEIKSYLLFIIVSLIFTSESLKYYFNFKSSFSLSKFVNEFSHKLRLRIYSKYLEYGKIYFDMNSKGHLFQVLTTNIRAISFVLKNLHRSLFEVLSVFVYSAIMLTISWKLFLVAVFMFPVLHFLANGQIKKIRENSERLASHHSELGKKISNSLSLIPVVKMYSTESSENNAFRKNSLLIQESQTEAARLRLLLQPIKDYVVLVSLAVLLFFTWMITLSTGGVGVGKYLVFVLILKRSTRFFGSINNIRASFAEIEGPLLQIEEVLNADPSLYIVESGDVVFDKLKSSILIEDLNFSYPGKKNAIESFDLEIENGQTLAIVGRSGAGKSTFINILSRLYECESNSIFINGIDIKNYQTSTWTNKIALVSQDSFLFHGSLRENLAYGVESLNDEEIISAITNAGLVDLVNDLPEGLDTLVGDKGVMLSGGERQRVSIARAYLKKPEIIILDEPTSALDSQTESEIQKGLDYLCKDKTVIIIAHRLSTIKNADKIVVMENGKIVEQGHIESLLNNAGAFKKYWDSQQL